MVRVVGVRFKKAGKIYYFDPDIIEVSIMISSLLKLQEESSLGMWLSDLERFLRRT